MATNITSDGAVTGANQQPQAFRLGVIDRRLTPGRLVASDYTKQLASVLSLADWLRGAPGRVTVTDNGDGTATIDFVEEGSEIDGEIVLGTASAPAAAVDTVSLHANDQQGRAGDHALHITPEATGRGYSFGTQAQLGGGLALPITTKTADYTATLADHTILIDASAGNVTVSLPAVATTHNGANGVGHIYRIKRIDASGNAATIEADGDETIDGAGTHALAAQYDAIAIQSDGSAWHIIGSA